MKECSLEECLEYMIDNLNSLVNSRNYCDSIESFAQWNAADDLASEWENCGYFINRLFEAGIITHDIKNKISEIDNLLSEASVGGSLYEEAIWTNDGLLNHRFWELIREKAAVVLNDLLRLSKA
ncbi:MAG: hypothetical protein J1F33_05295 [Clostridiales bacterium]|nr:hypothetical protein [Clostridiales bacterium]